MSATTGTLGNNGGITRELIDGVYHYSAKDGREDWAVNSVNYYDAARFCNWFTTGNTELRVYALNAIISPESVIRDSVAWANGSMAIVSENEWYKAAFYNGLTSTYYAYTNRSDSPPSTSDANYNNVIGHVFDVTYGSDSYYGTYGQGGNVREWTDTIVGSAYKALRGGAFMNNESALSSLSRNDGDMSYQKYDIGFRVVVIPEPSTYAMIFGALALGLAIYRRCK